MKILICKTPQDQIEMFGEEGMFKSASGELYSYEVELVKDEDMVRITDALGRMIPIDVSELDDLVEVLERIANYVACKECISERLYNGLTEGFEIN